MSRYKKAAVKFNKKEPRINKIMNDILGIFLLGVIPWTAFILLLIDTPIPNIALGMLISISITLDGILQIVFTAKEKFGYGKEGYYYKHGIRRWLRKKEANENAYALGGILIAGGIALGVLVLL